MALPKKSGLDIILAMGGPKRPPVDESDYGSQDDGDDAGLPPEFEMAWREYHDRPSAQSFWDAVEACTGHKVTSDLESKKYKKASDWSAKYGDNSTED